MSKIKCVFLGVINTVLGCYWISYGELNIGKMGLVIGLLCFILLLQDYLN